MTRVTIDASTAAILASAEHALQLCDANGKVLGWFEPSPPQPTLQEVLDKCPTSEEEIERRIREELGTGRTWAEIRRDLEAR